MLCLLIFVSGVTVVDGTNQGSLRGLSGPKNKELLFDLNKDELTSCHMEYKAIVLLLTF